MLRSSRRAPPKPPPESDTTPTVSQVPLARVREYLVQERIHLFAIVTAQASSELDAKDIRSHRSCTIFQHLSETLEVSVDSFRVVSLQLLMELDRPNVRARHCDGLPRQPPERAVLAYRGAGGFTTRT